MTASLVIRMTTMGDESASESGISLGKLCESCIVLRLWVFGDLGMNKNNKGSIEISFRFLILLGMTLKRLSLNFKCVLPQFQSFSAC